MDRIASDAGHHGDGRRRHRQACQELAEGDPAAYRSHGGVDGQPHRASLRGNPATVVERGAVQRHSAPFAASLSPFSMAAPSAGALPSAALGWRKRHRPRPQPAGRRSFEGRIRELVEGHSTLQTVMAAMLTARAALKLEMEKLHKVILKIVREDEVCRRLMTVPGVGALTSITFKSAVDDPSRIASRYFRAHSPKVSVGPDRPHRSDHPLG